MATTTAKLTLSSADLLSDTLGLNVTSTLTNAGGIIGMTQSKGLSRKTTAATDKYTLFYGDEYTADKAAKIYMHNPSTTITEYFKIEIGGQTVGRLYAGDWALIPWSATDGVKQVFSLTLAQTWADDDTIVFDGVTVTLGTTETTTAMVDLVKETWYPNWTVVEYSEHVLRFTARSSNQKENLALADSAAAATGSVVTTTAGNGTATVAQVTEASGTPGDVRITPGQAANTVEYLVIYE
tara:strand:+ start:1244 stop:1960 length:717 start_codon:yes stop_codon:yes gene_type:complete